MKVETQESGTRLYHDFDESVYGDMEELSFIQDLPSDCTPGELEVQLLPIPKLCLPDTDCLSKDSCMPLESPPYTSAHEEPSQPIEITGKRKPRKVIRDKTARKAEMEKKKVIKQMRNRISAQRSRDRKKQEMEELRDETEKLRQENCDLKSQLQAAKSELELLRQMTVKGKETKSREKKEGRKNSRGKFLLAALLFGCVCMTSCITPLVKSFELPENVQKLTMEKVNAEVPLLAAENQLTSAQKARRRYIETASHAHQRPKAEAQGLTMLPAKAKESVREIASADFVGLGEMVCSADKVYTQGSGIRVDQ